MSDIFSMKDGHGGEIGNIRTSENFFEERKRDFEEGKKRWKELTKNWSEEDRKWAERFWMNAGMPIG